MRGLLMLGDQRLELRELPTPKPGPGEVLVKVARAAICGTDIHKYRTPSADVPRIGDRPMIIGHEPSGWVQDVGPGVSAFERGQRVMLAGVIGCGSCPECLVGFNTACRKGPSGLAWGHDGASASHIVWPARSVLALPDELGFDAATVLTCAGGTAYTVVAETKLHAEDRLAIIGLGPVGASLLLIARALGVRVIGVDVDERRLSWAQKLGVDALVNAKQQDPLAAVKTWSEGKGCDVVAECAGTTSARKTAIAVAATRGRVAMAGLGSEPVPVEIDGALIGRQLSLMGIAATPIAYFPRLITLATERRVGFDALVTHRFPLERASEAFELMASGACGKVLFEVAEAL